MIAVGILTFQLLDLGLEVPYNGKGGRAEHQAGLGRGGRTEGGKQIQTDEEGERGWSSSVWQHCSRMPALSRLTD